MKVRYDLETGLLGKAYSEDMVVPSPYIILTTAELNTIAQATDKVAFVINNQLVMKDKEEYEEEQTAIKEAEKEQERKSKLKMTKQDFFLYVLQPYNITYSALNTALATNDTLNACFNLCNHIYRYDTNFMGNIKTMLEAMTQTEIDETELMAFLDEQFEAHNAED